MRVHILLPPSESKAVRPRGAALDWDGLSHPELTGARQQVAQAVTWVSQQSDAAARLGVSPNLADEIARNTRLLDAPTLPASLMYTGVLYDAAKLTELTGADKTRANRRVLISSGLYGVVRPNDRLAPYRLSMGVNLPDVGPLASFWKQHLAPVLEAECAGGLIVDCRSSTYAASWTPAADLTASWVHIRVPGATHMAKHTRGLVTNVLVRQKKAPTRPAKLADVLGAHFAVTLHEPTKANAPWILDVSADGECR